VPIVAMNSLGSDAQASASGVGREAESPLRAL